MIIKKLLKHSLAELLVLLKLFSNHNLEPLENLCHTNSKNHKPKPERDYDHKPPHFINSST